MNDSDRELIEFTKDSVRQILSPKLSKSSILSGLCLATYFVIRLPAVSAQLTFLPKQPAAANACDIALLAISAMFGVSAIRQRFARGRLIGGICLLASLFLLLRHVQPFL